MPTILHRLARWAEESPESTAQRFKKAGSWHDITSSQVLDRIYALSLYLESRGFTAKDTGAIFAFNSPEWVQTEFSFIAVGGMSAGLYPNSVAKDIHFIIQQTEAKVLVVQNEDYFKRVIASQKSGELPAHIKVVLCFEGEAKFHPLAVSFGHALEEGFKIARESGDGKKKSHFTAEAKRKYIDKLDPRAGAFLIYTSGTTGSPKGVLLSQDNLVYTSDLVIRYLRKQFAPTGSTFSFLPLSHIAEKMQNQGVGISLRYVVNYATKFDNAPAELVEVQPTIMLSVPRLWEKMVEGVNAKIAAGGTSPKAKLAKWALGVGARLGEARFKGRAANPLDLIQWPIAERLVIKNVKTALGLRDCQLIASGAAPLPGHVGKWFRSLGMDLIEVYGQSESSGVITVTVPGMDCLSTVGRPAPGTEFKLAEDGEILSRGRTVFLGYLKDEATTKATIHDGWLQTGDLGVYTEKGLIQIRGRKKDIMKTSGGKMIAPSPIEEKIKAAAVIAQVCLVGDNRKYLSAIITLSEAALKAAKEATGGIKDTTVVDPATLAAVKAQLDLVNSELASFEQVKNFTVLARDFSIEEGEMTPTLKMKRNVIEERYRNLIDRMYD